MARALRLLIIALLFSSPSSFGSSFGLDGRHCSINPLLESLFSTIHGNRFNTERTLSDYKDTFSRSFRWDLRRLKKDEIFLDLGSGKSLAGEAYVSQYPRGGKYIGVTLKAGRPIKQNDRFQVIQKKLFEDIPNDQIPKAHLITDLYGIHAYSPDLDVVLQKTLLHMDKKGTFHLCMGDFNELDLTTIIDVEGNELSFSEWLSKIPGVKVKKVESPEASALYYSIIDGNPNYKESAKAVIRKHMPSLRITITDPDKVRIPQLKLYRAKPYDHTPVPIRFYQETGPSYSLGSPTAH